MFDTILQHISHSSILCRYTIGHELKLKAFVHKTVDAVRRRVNVLLVDVHQTGKFDQDGINASIRNKLAPHSTPIIDMPRHSTLAS